MDVTGHWRKIPERDSSEFLDLSWTARGLYALLWRKVDRKTGLLKLGRPGLRAVALQVATAADWSGIEPALKELVDAGFASYDSTSTLLKLREFEAGQAALSESPDAAKKRVQRGRDLSPEENSTGDTAGHVPECPPNRIEENRREETEQKNPPLSPPKGAGECKSSALLGNVDAPACTPNCGQQGALALAIQGAEPQPADPPEPEKPKAFPRPRGAKPEHVPIAVALLAELSHAIRRVRPNARPLKPTTGNLKYLCDRQRDGYTVDQLRHVVATYEARSRVCQQTRDYFDAVTPFREANIGRWESMSLEEAGRLPSSGGFGRSPPSNTDGLRALSERIRQERDGNVIEAVAVEDDHDE